MYLSPLKPKSCTGYNSHTVRNNLIMFWWDIIISGQVGVSQAKGQLLLSVCLLDNSYEMSVGFLLKIKIMYVADNNLMFLSIFKKMS